MESLALDLLRRRAATGRHTPHNDGASLALCIEGGSMRGVVSAGMVTALERLGWLHCFDAVYGSSAGAMNGAYFLAGQAAYGTTIYYEDINNSKFIDVLRPLRGRAIVDLDFLVETVMTEQKPLDTARIIASPVPLIVMATNVSTGRQEAFRNFQSGPDLLHALRAGATMPVVAGEPYTYRARLYLDALLTEPIPVPIAELEGHSHLIVLLTRPEGESPREPTLVDRLMVGRHLRKISPDLERLFYTRRDSYLSIQRAISGGTGPAGKAKVAAIRPIGPELGQRERRREWLVAGANRGLEAVLRAVDRLSPNTIGLLSALSGSTHPLPTP